MFYSKDKYSNQFDSTKKNDLEFSIVTFTISLKIVNIISKYILFFFARFIRFSLRKKKKSTQFVTTQNFYTSTIFFFSILDTNFSNIY